VTEPRQDEERSSGDASKGEALSTLVANHRRFLSFLKARVGNEALAEDILQAAFVKGAEEVRSIRDEESVVAWFYRVLRNAIIDAARRREAEARALGRFAQELPEDAHLAPPDAMNAICGCVTSLVDTIAPDYGDLLHRIDLEGATIGDVAEENGITPNNARVRLHRARHALRLRVKQTCGTCAEHGCLDCTCKRPAPGAV